MNIKFEGLVVSRKEIEASESFEYWVRFPDHSVRAFMLKSSSLEVGNKIEIEETAENSYKILRIV